MRTTGDVARELRVPPRTIQDAVRTGRIPSVRYGRLYLIDEDGYRLARTTYGNRHQ